MPITEALVPIVMFAGAFAMVFGIVYLNTRQNLAMIEKGMNPREKTNRPAPFRSLKTGLLLLGAGLGLLIAFFLDIYTIPFEREPVGLYFALIAIGGGIGLVISYQVERKYWVDRKEE